MKAPTIQTFLIAPLLVASFGCSDLEPVAEPSSDAVTNPPVAAATPPPEAAADSEGRFIEAAGLRLELPEGWSSVEPDSAMRLAQLSIPGSGGPGRVALFHFGVGGGGGVDANLGRWVGQIAGGSEPARDRFGGQGIEVHTVATSGTLKKSGIGSFPTEDLPGYTLYGAVIEGAGGPWYLRAVGPDATLREQADGWRALLERARTTEG